MPDGVNVRDLGQQHLKDVQYEHVYELSLDEADKKFPPLKVEKEGRVDAMAERFEQRISDYVEQQLERALVGPTGAPQPSSPIKPAAVGLAILLLVVAAVVGIVLLVLLVKFAL